MITTLDLSHHGDQDLLPGLENLAVNVRSDGTPQWLLDRLRRVDVSAYPDQQQALRVIAARHRRSEDEVLLTAGAAEAFVLIARALRPRHAVVIHPQFTEPEAALRAAGHDVERVVLPYPFVLDPDRVPDSADLVFVGNPTNPTSVLHPRAVIDRLRRHGRIVVVDEAFMDCVPGEWHSFADVPEIDGLVIVRSLTKTWALAGLRVGYVLSSTQTISELRQAQPLWPVSSLALDACVATAESVALTEVTRWSEELAGQRGYLVDRLSAIPSLQYVPEPSASFVLIDTDLDDMQIRLQGKGFAVRRGETFPGLGPNWIRVAVRDRDVSDRFITALTEVVNDA